MQDPDPNLFHRPPQREYQTKGRPTRRGNDFATLADVVRLINVALTEYERRHVPWYRRLLFWRKS